MPELFSFGATLMLLYMNIFSLFGLLGFFYPWTTFINKRHVLMLMLVLATFNYFVLYKSKRYVDVFDDFDKKNEEYKSWNKLVPLYIIFSILFMLIVLGVADYRHDGHL